MPQLLVNSVNNGQIIIDIEESGSYFDDSRVQWDTREDGELPTDIVLGKMLRVGNVLQEQADFSLEHAQYLEKQKVREDSEKKKRDLVDKDIDSLKNLSDEEIDAWAETNINTVAQLKVFNKKLIKLLIARGVL